MTINKTRTLAIILLTVSLIFQKCDCTKPGLDCVQTKYNFELAVRAYPDYDSISIGDTIWFEINNPIRFKDINTSQIIDYSNAENLGSGITFRA